MRLSDPRPTQKADILSLSPHAPGKEVETVSISPDGSTLASGGRDGQLIFMSLNVPTVIPRAVTKAMRTSDTVRHSCEILEQSRMRSASDPTDTPPSEGSTTELESANTRLVPEREEVAKALSTSRKRLSRHIERKPPDIAAVVTLRRTHDRRLKDKVVDIPTMIAHLSARASMIIENPSSSSSESNTESDDDSADSEDYESQFLVNVSERANQFMKQEKTVQGTAKEQHASPGPPPQKLSLLPNEALGKLKENRSVFEKRETEKERKTSLFEDNTMDSVVLLMKNFLDENKPPTDHAQIEQEYLHCPHERKVLSQEDADSLDSSSASVDSASESHHHASGHYSLTPERPNSEERTISDEGRQSSASTADEKRRSLKRGSSTSGNEYGDEVPLSMI